MEFKGYQIVRLLGKGGMSEVYEVEHAVSGAHYSIKLFTYARGGNDAVARFEAEGRLLARLDHPRIVKVHGFGMEEDSGNPYFVMDLVLNGHGEVCSLADVPEGSADEETVGKWYDDVREGLAYIHGRGVVHRDLKLQNILIGADGHAVIADFGISKVFVPEGGDAAVIDPVQTVIKLKSGFKPLMGSVGYMAPELELGVSASPRSDWFALGVIVYKLLTGTWFDARTDVAGMLETYDPVWTRIISKLLHSNPQGRECLPYAEMAAKARAARELALEELCLKAEVRARRARHVAWGVGALALSAVIGFCVAVNGRRQAEPVRMTPRVPGFDALFAIPAEAKGEVQEDAQGNVIMYSRPGFEAAQVDALVLTHRILTGLESGNITPQRAIEDLDRIYRQLGEDSDASPFDTLKFGDNDYMQVGDSGPLRMLFGRAIEQLKRLKE